jgi:hypothetical protein
LCDDVIDDKETAYTIEMKTADGVTKLLVCHSCSVAMENLQSIIDDEILKRGDKDETL